MANFQKHQKNVNGQVLTAPGATSYELGLWGPIDPRNNSELTVYTAPPLSTVKLTRGKMLPGQPVRLWSVANLPVGRTVLVAQDAGGVAWSQVTIDTNPGSTSAGSGKKYTDNGNEVPVQRTSPSAAQVVDMLLGAWPELTNNGARTLAAQFMAETGGGKYCFNWNLGNVKARDTSVLHMYLANVWECFSKANADSAVANAGGQARIPDADESKKHGWACPDTIVVYSPPHAQCRFRAYASLADGAKRWLEHHKAIAAKDAGFLTSLNSGDTAAVAHALKSAGYYTASEADYAKAMKRTKASVDSALGPLP
jgi:hypothetical protein